METQIMQTGFARQKTGEPKMDELAAAQNFSANWLAAYTNSHHEKRVASHFAERQIESFLPQYATRHRWKNRCEVNLELPLFPNYVFLYIDSRERVRALEVSGALPLVGFGRTLAPLPDCEIEALRSGLGQRKIEPILTSSSRRFASPTKLDRPLKELPTNDDEQNKCPQLRK
jgi:transcription antitermination factor NusG